MGAMAYTKICPDCNKIPPSPNSTPTPKLLFGGGGNCASNFFFNPLVWPNANMNQEKVFQFPPTTFTNSNIIVKKEDEPPKSETSLIGTFFGMSKKSFKLKCECVLVMGRASG